jgi:serine/threonine protein kinase
MELSNGTLVDNCYIVQSELGVGGTSRVYLATQTGVDRQVALKVLKLDMISDETSKARFIREGQIAASINHINIANCYSLGFLNDNTPYLAYEYVRGRSLRDVLANEKRLDPHRCLRLVAQVCAALDHAHRSGLVHRDLKPENLMLIGAPEAELVKIIDFGYAHTLQTSQKLTETGLTIGTISYMSPEQCQGKTLDGRSDIYALGCVLYEMLTGRPPFAADTTAAMMLQHIYENPRSIVLDDEKDDGQFNAIVAKAMSKSPANRYQTAQSFLWDINAILSGKKIATVPGKIKTKHLQTSRMGSNKVAIVAIASILSILVSAILLVGTGNRVAIDLIALLPAGNSAHIMKSLGDYYATKNSPEESLICYQRALKRYRGFGPEAALVAGKVVHQLALQKEKDQAHTLAVETLNQIIANPDKQKNADPAFRQTVRLICHDLQHRPIMFTIKDAETVGYLACLPGIGDDPPTSAAIDALQSQLLLARHGETAVVIFRHLNRGYRSAVADLESRGDNAHAVAGLEKLRLIVPTPEELAETKAWLCAIRGKLDPPDIWLKKTMDDLLSTDLPEMDAIPGVREDLLLRAGERLVKLGQFAQLNQLLVEARNFHQCYPKQSEGFPSITAAFQGLLHLQQSKYQESKSCLLSSTKSASSASSWIKRSEVKRMFTNLTSYGLSELRKKKIDSTSAREISEGLATLRSINESLRNEKPKPLDAVRVFSQLQDGSTSPLIDSWSEFAKAGYRIQQ